jgi:hypothetical protein
MFGCAIFERICSNKAVNQNSETTCFIFLKDYLMKISIVCALVMLLASSAYAQQTESIQQQKQQRQMKQKEEGMHRQQWSRMNAKMELAQKSQKTKRIEMKKTIKASPQVNIEKVEESEQPSGDN